MAAQQPTRASPELRVAPLSPRYRRNYTTPRGTTLRDLKTGVRTFADCCSQDKNCIDFCASADGASNGFSLS